MEKGLCEFANTEVEKSEPLVEDSKREQGKKKQIRSLMYVELYYLLRVW